MKFDNIKNVPCIGEKAPVVIEDTEDARCLSDPLYAAIMGENFCTNAPVIDGLYIRPASGVTIGSSGNAQFSAYLDLKYKDGTKKAIDVTEKAAWSSANSAIARSLGSGEFKGGEATNNLTVKVTATYTPSVVVDGVTKNYTDQLRSTSSITIKASCYGSAIDIVVVLDRSASMLKTDSAISGEETRTEAARAACRQLIKNSKLWDSEDEKIVTSGNTSVNTTVGKEIDRMAFVSYAGDDGEKRVSFVSGFVDTKTAALGLVDDEEFLVSEDCDGGTGKPGGGCWTSIGGGLQLAYDILKGESDDYDLEGEVGARVNPAGANAWPRKLIILLTDGYENVCDPDPIAVATAIRADRLGQSGATKAHDTMIAVVGFMLDSSKSIKRCSNNSPSGATVTVENYLKLIANCYGNDTANATSLTFFPTDHDGLKGLFGEILNTICQDNTKGTGGSNNSCHYIPTTGQGKGDTPQLRDQFGIKSGLKRWNVCKNIIDLRGKDLWNTAHPNAGMYVSLIGNTGYPLLDEADLGSRWELKSAYNLNYTSECQSVTVPFDHNFGGIETIDEFTLIKDAQYRLVLKMGGNRVKNKAAFQNHHGQHGAKLGSSYRVTIGGTQKGELEGVRATDPSLDGTLETVDGIPVLVTRKIDGAFYEFTEEVDPESGLKEYILPLPIGNGGSYKIRIEQFPYFYSKANRDFKHEIPAAERVKIFSGHNCKDIKGTQENPLRISDFSGFIDAYGKVVAGDRNQSHKFYTSGADEFLTPLPYGIVLAEVKLQKGTQSGNTWTTSETIFTEDFESETGVN